VNNKLHPATVVRHHPKRWWWRAIWALVAIFVVGSGLLIALRWFANEHYFTLLEERNALRKEVDSIATELASYQQQLAIVYSGADIDRQAINDIRKVVSEQLQTIADLNEEISFYKGLMDPSSEPGLSIYSWTVTNDRGNEGFQYQLVLQQSATEHKELKGQVNIDVTGELDGQPRNFSLTALSNFNEPNIPFQFRYFQIIKGVVQFPAGFAPRQVNIIVKATSPAARTIEQHYAWNIEQN
jgi:hypothetical protein